MPTVTFSERPVGTVNPVFTFSDNILTTVGRIVNDGAQPGSPVIAANTSYLGPVFLYFSRPVTSVSLMAGYFDNLSSTRIEFRDAQGHVLGSFHNQQYGVINFSFSSQVGIASVVVIDERTDAAGFSVDTVVFGPPVGKDPPLVAQASNPLAGVDRYYGEVGSTSLVFHETLGAGDTVDTIAFFAKAAGTVTFRIALDSDPANVRDVTLAVVAGHNRFSFEPPTVYNNALGYTARIDLDLALPSKDEAMDRWISEMGEKIIGATLDFQEFKLETLELLQKMDNAGDAAKLLGKIADAYGWLGNLFELEGRRRAIDASGPNWREETFVQLTDFAFQSVATYGPLIAGSLAGTPLLGLVGSFTGNMVYTFGFSDGVQARAREWYRTPDPEPLQFSQAPLAEAALADTVDIESLRFDPGYYLAQHADARQAVSSGAFGSAYLHYLAVGAALGYRPSQAAAPIPVSEIAVKTTPELARQGYNSALFAFGVGQLAGDGLSAAEARFNAALDDARTDGDSLDLDRTLTAVANRVARDAVLNRLDPPGQAFDGADLAGWIATLSNGKGLSQNFSSLAPFTGLQMFAVHSAATSAEEVLAAFLRDPASAAALLGRATKSVGIGEFGGVWVLIFSANTSSVPPAVEAGPLDVVLVGDTGSDALYAGGGRGTLSGGDGSDELVGGIFADRMDGGAGDDLISGGAGVDQMAGGPGNDIFLLEQPGDAVIEAPNAGIDEVRTLLPDTTAAANVENITGLLDTGQTLRGNGLANLIAGGAGADRMVGGLGNDVYLVGAGDNVLEKAGEGNDEVRTSLAVYALTAEVERLVGTSAAGQTLTGNALANVITGESGNDRIDGGGGVDQMAGGLGNDVYFVGQLGDSVTEAANAGTDEVRTSLSDTTAPVNVENITGLLATGQTLRGNGLANLIAGGAGADRMVGGIGNDVYLVGAGDNVIEKAGEGHDEVRTSLAAYTLTAEVERLVGTSAAGQALTGNAIANVITGGGGHDRIDGGGGVDQMAGGLGNDVYFVGQLGDAVIEAANAGIDEVRTSLADMTAPANVENITGLLNTGQTLRGNGLGNLIAGGTGADRMVGGLGDDVYLAGAGDNVIEKAGEGTDEVRTALAAYTLGAEIERLVGTSATEQALTGNALANVIVGGSGSDLLRGGGGADAFRYLAVTESYSLARDHILDFTPGTDKIELDRIDANRSVAGDQAFTWIGANAFTGSAGQLRAFQSGTGWIVEGDVNGDGHADLIIALTLQGASPLGAGDFLL